MHKDQQLKHFINTWPLQRVKNMSLEEYNKQGSKDTFCYMLEYGTRELGNISGTAYSSKFEIYERKDKNNIPTSKDYGYDSNYTWRNRAGVIKTKDVAFKYTRDIIVEVIQASQSNNFEKIDNKKLAPLVIWKIAFLYSDKKLLAISDRQAVRYLAMLFGMSDYKKARISALHKYLMPYVDNSRFWGDMQTLWELYANRDSLEKPLDSLESLVNRKGVLLKDIEDSLHQRNIKGIIVTKRHNKLQQSIFNELFEIYDNKVTMEEQNIDIKVEHDNEIDFYEVKIASSAKYCIRHALGQILEYAYYYQTVKTKNLIIIGNHPLTNSDSNYITHLKNILGDINFEYQYKS